MGLFVLFKKTDPKKEKLKTTKYGFEFHSDIERELYEKNEMGFHGGYRDLRDKHDYERILLDRINIAEANYKKDGNLKAIIREYEKVFIEADPPCKSSHDINLSKYYVKAGLHDKAWGYLNLLYSRSTELNPAIRMEQARILKLEKRWSYAVEMYMLAHVTKYEFREDLFRKDIKSSINKLGWDDNVVKHLIKIVTVGRKKTNKEVYVTDEYRKYCDTLNTTE